MMMMMIIRAQGNCCWQTGCMLGKQEDTNGMPKTVGPVGELEKSCTFGVFKLLPLNFETMCLKRAVLEKLQ